MKKLTFLFFLFSFTASAQNQGVKVFVTDENIDSSSLEKKYEVTRKVETPNVLPDRQSREAVLSNIELPKDWDELSKDIFFEDLKRKDLKSLVKKYPNLKEADLKALKSKMK